jgi:hypothetical protein
MPDYANASVGQRVNRFSRLSSDVIAKEEYRSHKP